MVREDVNKLINILKEKGKQLRKNKKISPIIYGIYNQYESHTDKKVIYNDYLAKESEIQNSVPNPCKSILHPMVWDKTAHKLHHYHEPQTNYHSSDES